MRFSPRLILKELALILAIVLVAYWVNQYAQSWLGKKAIEKTGFEHLSFEDTLAKAASEEKLVLVNFAAIWCSTCRKLDVAVLANPKVKERIESDYVFTRLEYESNEQQVFKQYGVTQFPTLMVLDAEGTAIRQLSITLEPDRFIAQL